MRIPSTPADGRPAQGKWAGASGMRPAYAFHSLLVLHAHLRDFFSLLASSMGDCVVKKMVAAPDKSFVFPSQPFLVPPFSPPPLPDFSFPAMKRTATVSGCIRRANVIIHARILCICFASPRLGICCVHRRCKLFLFHMCYFDGRSNTFLVYLCFFFFYYICVIQINLCT